MSIHIVSTQNGDDILGRLLKSLVRETGWTVSARPDDGADLNYFFPYLEYPKEGYQRTPTAAWFTHRDTLHSASKANRWDDVANQVSFRLTSSRLYLDDLSRRGKTALVTTPIEGQFRPRLNRRMSGVKPIVGIAGRVYPGGRKGERLVQQLANTGKYDLRAIGSGWPIPCRFIPWHDLPAWYWGLDIFVSTSLIEGIGHPPLEALACGIPVVVPQGVGVFDELVGAGVYHYAAGDYDALVQALDLALALKAKPREVSDTVRARTEARWGQEHLMACNGLLQSLNATIEPLPKTTINGGAFYIAYGKPSRTCAKAALQSWNTYMPDFPAVVCSDTPLNAGETETIIQPDRDIGGRWNKTLIYDLAPQDWTTVLYLDADTELIAPVPFFFDALVDGWEFVICKNPDKYASTRWMHRPDNLDEVEETFKLLGHDNFIQWNGGVFAFRRCDRVRAFFAAWHEEWQRWGGRDQAALLRALWRYPLRVLTLGNEWNTVTRYNSPTTSAGILHYPTTARRHTGQIKGRLDSPEAWSKVKK